MSGYRAPTSPTLSDRERNLLETMQTAPYRMWKGSEVARAAGVYRNGINEVMYRLISRGMVVRLPLDAAWTLTDLGRTVDAATYRDGQSVPDPLHPATPYTGRLGSRIGRRLMAALREHGGTFTYGGIVELNIIGTSSVAKTLQLLREAGWLANDRGLYTVTAAGMAADLEAPAAQPRPAKEVEPGQPKRPQHVGHMPPPPPVDTRRVVTRLPACPRCGGMFYIDRGLMGDAPELKCVRCARTARSMGLPYSVRRKVVTA